MSYCNKADRGKVTMEKHIPLSKKDREMAEVFGGIAEEDYLPEEMDLHYSEKGGHWQRSLANKWEQKHHLQNEFGELESSE